MGKVKNQFKADLPPCNGCDECGDLHEGHLYLLGYKKKYYCKVCFFKVAYKWPKPMGDTGANRLEREGRRDDADVLDGSDEGHINGEAGPVRLHFPASFAPVQPVHAQAPDPE